MVEVVERVREGWVFAPMACDGAASGECGRFSTSADIANEAERQKRSTEKQSFLVRAQAENLVWEFPRVLSLRKGSESCLFAVVVGRRVGLLDPRASYSARSSRVACTTDEGGI